jgi:hypothetical protein
MLTVALAERNGATDPTDTYFSVWTPLSLIPRIGLEGFPFPIKLLEGPAASPTFSFDNIATSSCCGLSGNM